MFHNFFQRFSLIIKVSLLFSLLFFNCLVLFSESISHKLVSAARTQIGVVLHYDTSYYEGGYPPPDRGTCTDLVERALRKVGYNLKEGVDADMAANPRLYPNKPDPNINFRRVANLKVFFDRHLTKVTRSTNKRSLSEWQPGDIVTYDKIPGSLWHIAIISDKKNKRGEPLLIHNYGSGVVEDDMFLKWPAKITGHYRIDE